MTERLEVDAASLWGMAKSLGFKAVGFLNVERDESLMVNYIEAMEAGRFADLDYLKRNCDKRADPLLLLPGAKTLMLFLIPYGSNSAAEEMDILFPESSGTKVRGGSEEGNSLAGGGVIERYKVSQYARGKDYHKVIKERLFQLMDMIKADHPALSARPFVDTAPLLERIWAAKAGLGFIGKNNFLINKKIGIRNFIGAILSNLSFKGVGQGQCLSYNVADLENSGHIAQIGSSFTACARCNRCIEACPTGALSPYSLDASKCLSYLTVEKKGANILENRARALERGGWIFGCDACLNACPWNGKNLEGWPEFSHTEEPLPASHLRRR